MAGRGSAQGRGRRGAAVSAGQTTTETSTARLTLDVPTVRARRQTKAPTIYSPVSEPTRGRKKTRGHPRASGRGRWPGRGPGRGMGRGTPLSPQSEDLAASASTGGASDASTGERDGRSGRRESVHVQLEAYIKTQASLRVARRLRYPLAFLDAYEAEGWRKASREKIKPSKELENARRKIVRGKRVVLDGLRELQALNAGDEQLMHLTGPGPEVSVAPEDIYCSRCRSTETCDHNDILLCDNAGCNRAYHQQCQSPAVETSKIPEGDELWYCEVCLAVFNCLKVVNSAFGTTYESVSQVFPELPEEEREGATASTSTSTGAPLGAGDDDDEQDDEDFVVSEDEEAKDEDEDESEDEEDAVGDRHTEDEPAPTVSEHVSDDELQYLSKDDVIDSDRRSARSRGTGASTATTNSARASFVGREVAKLNDSSGSVVRGVVMELAASSTPTWRVVYRDDTMQLLDENQLQAAMTLASEREDADERDGADQVDQVDQDALIIHGKRKRSAVNYRALNDLLFAGKADSDAEEEEEEEEDAVEYQDEGAGNADDDDYEDSVELKAVAPSAPSKRARRHRNVVDYRAMHEGGL